MFKDLMDRYTPLKNTWDSSEHILKKSQQKYENVTCVASIKIAFINYELAGLLMIIIKHLMTGPQGRQLSLFPENFNASQGRPKRSIDIQGKYTWKFWSWKFIKPRSSGSCQSTLASNSALYTLWYHYLCNIASWEILVGDSFIVRCHVTSK